MHDYGKPHDLGGIEFMTHHVIMPEFPRNSQQFSADMISMRSPTDERL
jgi:hypothetical protein